MKIAALFVHKGGVYYGLDDRPRVGKRKAAATPIEFRDVLLGIAWSVEVAS